MRGKLPAALVAIATRPWVGTSCRLLVGAVFIAAAGAKLLASSPAEIEAGVAVLLPLPAALTAIIARTLPLLELSLGLWLFIDRPRQKAAWAAVGLMVLFTLLLVRAAWIGTAPEGCACFGPASSGSIHLDIARNLLLTALAARAAI